VAAKSLSFRWDTKLLPEELEIVGISCLCPEIPASVEEASLVFLYIEGKKGDNNVYIRALN
jgi:hypothetical protein